MSWLIITLLSYFFLAVVSLFDRYFLVGSIPSHRVYTFYIGSIWLLISLVLLPWVNLTLGINILVLGLAAGLIRLLAAFFLTKSIIKGEISRVVPSVGGLVPIFSFLLFVLFLPPSDIFNFLQITAFLLLLAGSILISLKKFSAEFFNFKIFKYPLTAALFFALNFFLSKNLFLKTDFWSGLFLILLGGGLGALAFLLLPSFRKEIFSQKPSFKTSWLFLSGQLVGGAGVLLQTFAVFLAKPGQVPLINALEGTRYALLLLFVFLLSGWKPDLLKEEMAGTLLSQKILAVLLIGTGLMILAFS